MAGVLHTMWVRHHLRPGEFFDLPRGEQLFLMASTGVEVENLPKTKKGGGKRG